MCSLVAFKLIAYILFLGLAQEIVIVASGPSCVCSGNNHLMLYFVSFHSKQCVHWWLSS